MFILSNRKFLAAFAMVACLASVANADQVRRSKLRGSINGLEQEVQDVVEVESRYLKKNKKKKKKTTGVKAAGLSFGFVGNANTVSVGGLVQKPVGHIAMFEEKCPDVTVIDDLNTCVGNNLGDERACKQCLISKQSLNLVPGASSLKSCFQKEFSGFCTPACADEALQYFGCGTGRPGFGFVTPPVVTNPVVTTPVVTNPVVTTPVTPPSVTTPVVTTPAVTTPAVTTPVVTTPGTTVTTGDSGLTTTVTATASSSTSGEAPTNLCPLSLPGSGTDCDLQGYDSMTCWYPGYMKCVCGVMSPIFLCTDES